MVKQRISQYILFIISVLALFSVFNFPQFIILALISLCFWIKIKLNNKLLSAVFFGCWILASYWWLIESVIINTKYQYISLFLVVLFLLFLEFWISYLIINWLIKYSARYNLIWQHTTLFNYLLIITAVNYINSIIFSDWYFNSTILESKQLINNFRGIINILGADNAQLLLLLAINLIYIFIALKHYIKLAIATICLLTIIIASNLNYDRMIGGPTRKIELALISSPIKNDNNKWHFYQQQLQKIKEQNKFWELAILPENSYDGLIEQSQLIPYFLDNFAPDHSILLGANRELPNQSDIINHSIQNKINKQVNSSFLFTTGVPYYQYSDKYLLVPGAEYAVYNWSWLKPLAINGTMEYSPGQPQLLNYHNFNLAIAICFEAILSKWYRSSISNQADLLIILASEYLFSPKQQQKIDQLTRIKMLESGKPWLKQAANGSIIVNGQNVTSTYYTLVIHSFAFNSHKYYYIIPVFWLLLLIIVYRLLNRVVAIW